MIKQKIEDGEIVTEPGMYDMDIEYYHSQCCDGPSISSTGIRRLLASPAEFWKLSDLNPDRVEEESKKAFILGRAVHHLSLGEANFDEHFVLQPELAPDGRKWHAANLSCKEWAAQQEERGVDVLTPTLLEQIKGMAGLLPWQKNMPNCGLANSPLVSQGGVLSGEIEQSLIFKIGKTWIKTRPDAIPGSSNDFADLKTTATGIDDRALAKTVLDRGYHIQGAMVGMGSDAVLKRKMEGFHLVFVDTKNVHAVSIRTLADEDIVRGERAVFAALEIFERCMETNIWPGPTARQADAQLLSLPAYGRENIDRILEQIETENEL